MSPVRPEDAPERAVFPVARVRPQSRRDRLHGALVAALCASLGAGHALAGVKGLLVCLGALVVPSLALLAWQRERTPAGGAEIEAGKEGLFADGKLLVPRADMKRAVVMAGAGGSAVVSIQRSQGFHVAVDVPDEQEGQRLVSALGLAADQRAAEFPVDSALAVRVPAWLAIGSLMLLLGLAMAGIGMGTPAFFLGVVPWYAFVLAWLHPGTLTIGTDGVLLSWLGRRTLVRFSEMVACVPEPDGLRFDLSGGRTVRIRARQLSRQWAKEQPELASADVYMAALAGRIQQARAAAGGADVAVLDRKERPLPEWIRYLRALTAREADGFRSAPVLEEALWKTVENGHAEPAARAAAAVALGPSLDDRGRERLRVAAAVVAAPKLRVALSAAAEGDDDAVASALSELEAARDEGAKRPARRGLAPS